MRNYGARAFGAVANQTNPQIANDFNRAVGVIMAVAAPGRPTTPAQLSGRLIDLPPVGADAAVKRGAIHPVGMQS
jgi:hypothetical protein